MAYILNTLIDSKIKRSLISAPIINAGEVARYFSTFSGGDSTYLMMDSPPVISGDFSLSVDVAGANLTKDQAIIDSAEFQTGSEGEILVYIDNPDGLQVLIGNGSGGFSRTIFGQQQEILNGKLNTLTFKRVSGMITAELNGVDIGSSISYSGDILFSEGLFFGGSSRYFDGIAANISLASNGVLYTYKIDNDSSSDTEASNGKVVTYININERLEYTFDSSDNSWNNGETKIYIGEDNLTTWSSANATINCNELINCSEIIPCEE